MSTVQFVGPLPEQQKIHVPASNQSRLRPILKSLPMPEHSPLPFSAYPLHSPHVHFPPTPALTSTTFTHSAIVYDRAPIVVAENVCALPERGGRYYTLQQRAKESSRRVSGHCHPDVGVGRISTESNRDASEPKGSYFHPRAFEVCQPEPTGAEERYVRYDSYFLDSSSSSSEPSSSSSSESDSDSDSSYDLFSPSSSIPCVAVDAFILGGSLSTYPSDSSLIQQSQNVPSQRFTHLSTLRQSQQQLSHTVHYARSPSPDLAESKPKKTVTSGRKVKSRRSSSTSTSSRLSKFSGGFSDQSMFLDGCLGGF